jgi:peptidyl-prolyl cis-trans isomerase A (cyclophilin A)
MLRVTALAAAVLLLAACQGEDRAAEPGDGVRAEIVTSQGVITVALDLQAAPQTVRNFVDHARSGTYDGGAFYRAVRPDNDRPGVEPMHLIQGGYGFDGAPGAEPVAHESTAQSGLTHERGAISMARFEPGSATSEFFIMVEDYPGLDAGPDTRNPDGEGYAVFGQVVDGMDVVEAIASAPTSADAAPEDFNYAQFLVEPVTIETVRISSDLERGR